MRSAPVLMCLSLGAFFLPSHATGSIAQPTVVSQDPANFTPNVEDDAVVDHTAVFALGQLGGKIYAGGTFHKVQNAARTQTYTRNNMMAFNATTGDVDPSFLPTFNAPVWAIEPSGTSLYVGGDFTTVNGAVHRGLVKIDAATGEVDSTFKPAITSGSVTEIRLVNGRLIIGGSFPKRLAALNPTTGADTGYINLAITGKVASNTGATTVYRFAVNPAGTRLVALGNFTSVGGQSRKRAFMLTLGATAASLNAWYYQPLENMCRASSIPQYMRDVDFSPDGSYFVFASTGYIPLTGG
ncbi:MAG: hypothetical protein H0V07_10840, partial [Propionibacteriales bacterium]|nr:hypothetical protein [Propionibacteriales bacterium]